MNIFVLDKSPWTSSEMMCDKHVVKMMLETAQLLSTAHRILDGYDGDSLYKATHINHPCAIWVRENPVNYFWTMMHLNGLSNEYTKRYGKIHKTWSTVGIELMKFGPPKNIPNLDQYESIPMTPFAKAMPDQYKIDGDPVASYRAYYIGDKDRIAKWKHGNVPVWYTVGLAEKYRKLWFEEEGYVPSVSDADMINMYQEKHNYWAKRARKVKS